MSESLLDARDLCKSYEKGKIEALTGVNLTVNAGDFIAISGPSGCGKSTLLQLLGGLDSPSSGQILFQGASIGGSVGLDRYRSRHVGFVFQAFHLLPSLRAIENVQIPLLAGDSPRRGRAEKARALLCEVGLEHRLHHYPSELSGGERQRVAIARSLSNDPDILLADEPTGNLDSVSSGKIMEVLAGLKARRGMTMILVTHEPEIAESAERHIRMRDGRILE